MKVPLLSSVAACAVSLLSFTPTVKAAPADGLWSHDNLLAWCTVPFDAKKRGPEERAEMLERLGFTMFAYDWRSEHIPTFDAEIEALEKHHIKLQAWWFPNNPNDPTSKIILEALKRHNEHPQLWVMFNGALAKTPEETQQRLDQMTRTFQALEALAKPYGCPVEIYSHNGWGGNEDNELAVIARLKELGITDIGMVYNFSHAHDKDHDDTAGFPELWTRMQPHVVAVNVAGMSATGGEVYPGQGVAELELMRTIQNSGWHGPVGVIAEQGGDNEVTLAKCLKGLDWLAAELKQPGSGGPRPFAQSAAPVSAAAPATARNAAPAYQPVANSAPASAGVSASTGPLHLVDGKFGKAADLTGSPIVLPGRDEYRQVPITVECWVKLKDATDYNILLASDPKASRSHWEMYSGYENGFYSVYLPGRGADVHSAVNLCDDAWHYVAMVLEEARVRLYVDGDMVKDAALTPLKGDETPGGLCIGQLVEGDHECRGAMQDVRISRGVREIRDKPKVPLTRDATTIDLWPLNGSPASGKQSGTVPGPATGAVASDSQVAALMPVTNTGMFVPPTATNSLTGPLPSATPSFAHADPASLPQYVTIPAAAPGELTPANGWPAQDSFTDWTRSHGGPTGNRYSALTQITKDNVKQLAEAWVYHSKDGGANIQCNPIIVDGTVYLPTAGLYLAAVDGATGQELWRYAPEKQGRGLEDVPARRGLLYWPGDASNPPRIIFSMGTWMYALDPRTGKPIASFGEGGRARLPKSGCAVAPAVYKNVLVFPGYTSNCYGYDVRTGVPLWVFDTQPKGSAPGAETWSTGQRSGANCWGGMALDESRGIAYFATGSPKPNFIGYQHDGDNLFSDCVIALDAATGKYLWHFQEIRHDVWDLDIPAPPNLVTVTINGKKVDAVAQVTKIGNTLLLDRVTGKNLFPFRLRRAPAFTLPGDTGSPYQPDLQLPQPFARQEYTMNDVTNLSPEAHESVMKNFISRSNLGWFVPFEENKPSVYFGIHGGAEWTGAAVNPQGHLFVSASELPWLEVVNRVGGPANQVLSPQASRGKATFGTNCAACHGEKLEGNGIAPSLIALNTRLKEDDFRSIMRTGRNGMPPQPQLSEDNVKDLVAYLLPDDDKGAAAHNTGPARFADAGYTRVLDNNDYPGCTPPWGTLSCINLNTGKIDWKVPLGEYPELKARGIPKTGTENFGGASVTASGLVFVSGTRDNQIRAFDADNGKELWMAALPLHGTAPPAIYQAKGREFIVLPATGGGKLGGATGDSWVAFALPHT